MTRASETRGSPDVALWEMWLLRRLPPRYTVHRNHMSGKSASRSLASTPRCASVHYRSALRFDTDPVVDGSADPLFTTKVALRSLNRNVAEEELDLFQFSACCVT
jgi:hypothetical protein